MKTAEENILQICYKFPPIKSMGATRNYNVALQLKEHFKNHFVITTKNQSFLPNQALPLCDTFNAFPVSTFDYRTFLHYFFHKNSYFQGNLEERTILSWLVKLRDSFPFNVLLDEGSLIYIFNGYRQGKKLIRQHNIRYIYSSFRPYADHIIAWMLKRWRPELHWIADFRDPHVDLNRRNVFFPKVQHSFDRKIFQMADTVITVSQGLAKYFERYGRAVHVLHNGINPGFEAIKDLPYANLDRFTISYTGSLYADQQTAAPLFAVLNELITEQKFPWENIQLIYAGKDRQLWDHWIAEFGLAAINKSNNIIDIRESLAIQRSSHINLLLSWSGPVIKGILTGKLFEYLDARRPILGIVNGEYDNEFANIFASTKAGLVTFTDQDYSAQIKRFVLQRYAAWENQMESEDFFHEPALKAYYWPEMMQEFIRVLK